MKTTRILWGIACALIFISSAFANTISVNQIQVQDAHTIRATFSENPNLDEGIIDAEIKVLQDINIIEATQGELEDTVKIILGDEILSNTSYSLLNISGAEGSIDFDTEEIVEGFESSNDLSDQEFDIDNIEIIDTTTIIVTYRGDIDAEIYEFKLLAEHTIDTIKKPVFSTPELLINVNPWLKGEGDYILMFIELQDVDGDYLEFDTGIYDFSTWKDIIAQTDNTSEKREANIEEEQSQKTVVELEELPELNTAGLVKEWVEPKVIEKFDDIVVEDEEPKNTDTLEVLEEIANLNDGNNVSDIENIQKEISVREAAGLVSEHPEAGPTTWVLVLVSIFINTFYYFTRRKKTLSL